MAEAPGMPPPAAETFERFRARARALLAAGVPPQAACGAWADLCGGAAAGDLFAPPAPAPLATAEPAAPGPAALGPAVLAPAPSALGAPPAPIVVPRRFVLLARRVALHRDPARFDRLYGLLWRLAHEPGLRRDLLDPDWLRLRHMARAVQRDASKMRAFVRFRPVPLAAGPGGAGEGRAAQAHPAAQSEQEAQMAQMAQMVQTAQAARMGRASAETGPPARAAGAASAAPGAPEPGPAACGAGGPTLHVAWFEPEHDVLEAVAPWFARRFANMHWAILTPRRSVHWDPHAQCLHHGPGARREHAPTPDAGEGLWLTYYRHSFNPARLNLPLMRQHMPRKYWANLPEAAEIGTLAAQAPARTAAMTAATKAPRAVNGAPGPTGAGTADAEGQAPSAGG